MRLSGWITLVAVMVGLGCLQVSQRNALFLKGYEVGERMSRVHAQDTDVSWLRARVGGLTSPTRLARVAQERRLQLVAWSTLERALETTDRRDRETDRSPSRFTHLAAVDPDQPSRDENTAD